VLVMLAIAALGAGGVVAWEWRQRAQANGEPPAAAAVDAGVAVADEVGVQARRRPVIEIASPVVTNGSSDDEILARGLREALVLGIGDSPDVELRPVAVESSLVAARRSGVVMVIGGQIERREGAILQGPAATIVISVKVLDVQSGALRFAERFVVAHQPDLAATIDTIVDKIRRATLADAAARPAPTPAKETAAFLDWARGLAAEDRGATYEAIASYHHAATEDPTFFPPRVRLIELGGTPDDPSFVDTTRQLAAGAGEWGAMTLRAALAPTPEERLVALEAIVARFPHDVHRSAALAVTYREVGRAADCLAVGQRALDAGASSELRRSLAWCAIESGDGDAAARIAAELATTDPAQGAVLLGDVHMLHGRFGKAREEYQRARDAGVDVSGRLAVVNLHAGGRCAQRKGPMPDGEEGRAWGTVDAACGRQRTNAAPRETKLPEKVLPIHRHPFLEPPVLIDVAIARAEAGDREDAALVCQEILAAAPSYAPGHYCLGRVAQAGKDWQAAFRSYREFLDRWADAAEENRMVRDATRRLNAVIRAARQESARQTP
jgi:tetratricopeptide (TPR) repeat protein